MLILRTKPRTYLLNSYLFECSLFRHFFLRGNTTFKFGPEQEGSEFILPFYIMVTAVSASLSLAPRSARMSAHTSSSAPKTSKASVRPRPRETGPLKGVVAIVDVRVGGEAQIDCSDVVSRKLREMGASTVKRLTPKITHVVLSHFTPAWKTKILKWQGSGGSMAAAAARYGLKIVSQLWVNACFVSKRCMDERPFFPVSKLTTVKQKSTTDAISKEAATTPLSNYKNLKAMNKSSRKRALSMEPMTSDAIIKILGSAIEVAEINTLRKVLDTPKKQTIQSKCVSSSAKRRKTLNGPLTQLVEDEVTVSQASEFVAESESDHQNDGNEKVIKDAVTQNIHSGRQTSPAPRIESGCLSPSSSTPATSSGDSNLTPSNHDSKQEPTARELRRKNRSSLTYGSGLMLKSGIWSCGVCGCSNPGSQRHCSDCQVSRGSTKSLNGNIATVSPAAVGDTKEHSLKTPATPSTSTLTSKTSTAEKSVTPEDASSVTMINRPSAAERASNCLMRPTVSSAAKTRNSISTAVRTIPSDTKIKSLHAAIEVQKQSPTVLSSASNQATRYTLAPGPVSLDVQPKIPLKAMDRRSTGRNTKKRARSPALNNRLATPVLKKGRQDSTHETTIGQRPLATPGSVSGFIRKHREGNSTPIPMAMSFSSTTNRTTTRKRSRNIFGITGVSSETRGVLQCAIHAIDANMANEDGYKKARVVKSVDYAAGVTHLIVGRDARRTMKVLFAIARGAWIVTEDWVFSSLEQERWLPEEDYEVTIFANKYSREHPEFRQLFKATKFFVGSKVEPSREVLQSLIQVAGGEICNQISVADICICGDASLLKRAQRMGIRAVTSKWVFDSIATMKLVDDAIYATTDALDAPVKTPSKRCREVESFGTPAFTPLKRRPDTNLGLEAHSTVPE
ncbi:putative BRCT domain, Zinc finger, RanBP2-type, microcephalin, BRCT domain superfamily [Plasmopara halstedii]